MTFPAERERDASDVLFHTPGISGEYLVRQLLGQQTHKRVVSTIRLRAYLHCLSLDVLEPLLEPFLSRLGLVFFGADVLPFRVGVDPVIAVPEKECQLADAFLGGW